MNNDQCPTLQRFLHRATVEVNNPENVIVRSVELLLELRVLKKEKELDYAFCSVVDLNNKTTTHNTSVTQNMIFQGHEE